MADLCGEHSCRESNSHSCAKVTHPGLEVHRSAPVEQQRRYVDVPVVSGDVQRREAALARRDGEKRIVQEGNLDCCWAAERREAAAKTCAEMAVCSGDKAAPACLNVQVKQRLRAGSAGGPAGFDGSGAGMNSVGVNGRNQAKKKQEKTQAERSEAS